MLKAYKYRLMPTKTQTELLNKHIGSCRFVYNLALETKKMAYAGNKVNLSRYDLQAQLPELKKECVWLKEINAQSLQVVLLNLDNAFNYFFKGQGEFPKFKKKRNASGKKPGAQTGHLGVTLMPVENPDIIVDIPIDRTTLPAGFYVGAGVKKAQVVDIKFTKAVTVKLVVVFLI